MINRMLGRLPESVDDLHPDMAVWPDNLAPAEGERPSWYYLYIQSATNSYGFEMKTNGIHETWTGLIAPRPWEALERPDSRPEHILA